MGAPMIKKWWGRRGRRVASQEGQHTGHALTTASGDCATRYAGPYRKVTLRAASAPTAFASAYAYLN
ncbi:unnamed protein product [Cuscuta campestris]|uniref:Uncharacterized protein n=1 Tax=Cuscuta campestris TaxID=132261 RepID=A0A484KVY7_9ASTE|nr:unnamed protein product [Cuscuta campestris]